MDRHRRVIRIWDGFLLLIFILFVSFGIANALIPAWGSTPEELEIMLADDDIFTNPVLVWKHAITINSAPENVWPWIAQMGDTRGGYYSYRIIEKAVTAAAGINPENYYMNTNRIHPEWQNPVIGQGMIMETLVVRDIKPGQYLLAGPPPEMSDGGLSWVWAVTPTETGKTRLLVHMQIQIPGAEGNKAIETVLNLSTFMMERKMIEGIRLRAEGGYEADWVEIVELLIWLVTLVVGISAAFRFITRVEWKLSLAIAVASVVTLFVLVYLQPAIWLRVLLLVALCGATVYDIYLITSWQTGKLAE